MIGCNLNEEVLGSFISSKLNFIWHFISHFIKEPDVCVGRFYDFMMDVGFVLWWKKLLFIICYCSDFERSVEVSYEGSSCSRKFCFVLSLNWLKQELRFRKCRLVHFLIVNYACCLFGQSGSIHLLLFTIQFRDILKSCILSINQRREYAGSAVTSSSEDG
jgi:hypothetical protein